MATRTRKKRGVCCGDFPDCPAVPDKDTMMCSKCPRILKLHKGFTEKAISYYYGRVRPNNIIEFDDENIQKNIPHSKGVYLLMDSRYRVGYVGRSDHSLKERLKYHQKKGRFKFVYYFEVDSAIEGFFYELHLFKKHRTHILNRNVPGYPEGIRCIDNYSNHDITIKNIIEKEPERFFLEV